MASHPPSGAGWDPRGQGSVFDFGLVVEVLQNKVLVGQSLKRSLSWGWPLGRIKQGLCKLEWVPFRGLWPADAANHSGRADLWTANVEFPFVQPWRHIKQFGFSLGDGHCAL